MRAQNPAIVDASARLGAGVHESNAVDAVVAAGARRWRDRGVARVSQLEGL